VGCDPITRFEHVTSDLRLHRVHIVHQVRRAKHEGKKRAASHGQNDDV
jgi:hypothetical protein